MLPACVFPASSCSYLVVEHQLRPPVGRRVLAEQRPRVGVNVVTVEVALQGLAVAHAGVQVAAQRVDLPPLGVDAHLVAGTSARTTLGGAGARRDLWHTHTQAKCWFSCLFF